MTSTADMTAEQDKFLGIFYFHNIKNLYG